MPKLGDTQKMSDEENIWGMWDGCFWSKVHWLEPDDAGVGGWLIPIEMVERLGWYDERKS